MSTPSEIKKLIERLDRELTFTEQETREGINLLRPLISRFPDNLRLIRFFSLLNNILLFVEISRRRIQAIIERVSISDVTAEEIQESGEDLSSLLGQVLDTKIEVVTTIEVLRKLQ
ncbi:MAG: restriction endonuclease subunit S [Xenococcaceae cyanobacterium MO_188.B29]|nr:restriction endonuclease subunit S [Xenococcaceae cyanobacterium MO_188.B29]